MIELEAPNGNAGKKRGRLSHGHKEPPNYGGGLDWDAIRRQFEERLQQDIDNGVDDVMTRAELRRRAGLPPLTKPKPRRFIPDRDAQRRGGLRTGPRYDVDRMVELYEEGKRVREIAAVTGGDVRTVREWLTKRGVYDPKRDRTNGGPPPDNNRRLETCGKGHDLKAHGVQLFKPNGAKNGWACTICRDERNRDWKKRANSNGK